MENGKRWGIALLIMVGVALVLCAGMIIGGAVVYGVLRIDDALSSRDVHETVERQLEEVEVEQLIPEFASGVVIVDVVPGSPAEEAGLQVGDLILAVDGQEIALDGNLAAFIGQYEPGDRVTLQIQAEGEQEPRAVRVTLGEDPEIAGKPYLGVSYRPALLQGLNLKEMTPFRGQGQWELDDLPMPETQGGVHIMVMSVTAGSPADIAGVRHGDMITSLDGESFDSAAALVGAIARREPGDTVTLGVLHAGEEAAVDLQVRLDKHPEQAGAAYLGVTVRDIFRVRPFPGRQHWLDVTPEPPLP